MIISLALTRSLRAQTLSILHHFTATAGLNSDGATPMAKLTLSGHRLFGTTYDGGGLAGGTIFSINTDGSSFTNLHNSSSPRCGLTLSGETLYGTTIDGGGGFSSGTVFKISTDGTAFAILHAFDRRIIPNDGFHPSAPLLLLGDTLYGTTVDGGSAGYGIVFSVNTDGSDYRILHSFNLDDGANPYSGLVQSGDSLFGTTIYGGEAGNGTIFKLNTNGAGFGTLHSFGGTIGGVNSDGALPYSTLVLSGSTLYGTAELGGMYGNGTVFSVTINGTGFTTLHDFTGFATLNYTNDDGAHPLGPLLLSGSTLYGTASNGGHGTTGVLFKLDRVTRNFETLYHFAREYTGFTNADGANPVDGLIVTGNAIYGVCANGGAGANGTVFQLSIPVPQLAIAQAGTNVLLRWSTNPSGFTLQSTPSLVGSVLWSNVSSVPILASGEYIVTNSATATQKFFRLSQ